jgi:hypothetical protein
MKEQSETTSGIWVGIYHLFCNTGRANDGITSLPGSMMPRAFKKVYPSLCPTLNAAI